MKADATITETTIKLEKKNKQTNKNKKQKTDQSSTLCQALKKKVTQILSQNHKKHCLKRTGNSSRESSATIYEL